MEISTILRMINKQMVLIYLLTSQYNILLITINVKIFHSNYNKNNTFIYIIFFQRTFKYIIMILSVCYVPEIGI